MRVRPSIQIRPGWTGAVFKLDRKGAIPAVVRLGEWEATLRRSHPFLAVETKASAGRDDAVRKSLEVAEKSLDLLATGGAGAYRVEPGYGSVHWWTENGQTHASIHGRLELPFDWRMTVTHLDQPEQSAGNPKLKPGWRAGFRFFRMAQTARDPVSAFRDTYLAVENLLADLHPRRTKPRREAEKEWLSRALDSFNKSRPQVDGTDWLGHIGLDDFIDTVYTSVRHPTFHAKAGERFLLPLDAGSEKKVRRAIVPLTRLFLELAAETLKNPLNERPQLEHELVSSAQWIAHREVWPFQDSRADGEAKKVHRTVLRLENHPKPAPDASIAERVIPREVLRHVGHVDGWIAFLDGKPVATEELGLRLPVESLESLALRVVSSVRFGAMVRTEFR